MKTNGRKLVAHLQERLPESRAASASRASGST